MNNYHIPVLLKESVDGLNISPGGTYVDVTFGGGGHSAEILQRLTRGRLYAFDQDADAINNLPGDNKLTFTQGNFRYISNYLKYYGVKNIDGLLADLGVSSHHFNNPDRGFTYRTNAPLDMRMNRSSKLTAEIIINEYDEETLSNVLHEYGELFQARKLAAAIVKARQTHRISTVMQLINSMGSLIPKQSENQFLSKVFQALRIEVNREIENLGQMLESAAGLLNTGGRLVVISYHSLEDRLVKNFMRWGNVKEQPQKDIYGNSPQPFINITRKPITSREDEIAANPRARSARLRIAEKK